MPTTRTPRAPQLTLEITEQIIEEAIPRDSSHCMIAEAVKIAHPTATHISVDLQTIRFTDAKKGLRYTYLTPRVGQIHLVNFDQGIKPEPLAFRIRNGQVTRAGKPKAAEKASLSAAALKQRRDAAAKSHAKLAKARLVQRNSTTGGVPDKVGGQTPPLMPIARRRAFGLRALAR